MWERVHIPVLENLGELDQNVRVAETAPILERALTKAGDRDFTIKIWPGADHSILVTSKAGRPHFADGFMDSMAEWLLKRVTVNAPAQAAAKRSSGRLRRAERFARGTRQHFALEGKRWKW